ncbi:PREDICTED: very-long-chain 3-oxoacyl-CoA reductase-like protein At1g24470 [Fragaria vesca subsp. vesca]|uniref:very-long-chain 3-oxoacyl-CoA reductase-like protein At1g24470 n=1 Tax=Fragaria vesca subsp. vesca TaxID=101020 RepID=UPI0002C34878|nr:PREDICTED: very-long-chain 3-oxoacyl-CoA reductase-like protein At1g24470 [Fragaria vesca subsp. vesca]
MVHTSRAACNIHEYLTNQQPVWLLLLSSLGFFIFLKHSISLARWLFITFLRPAKDLERSYGSWGLITGATDGIGKAFAYQLAKKGLNLVLVSRSSNKLESVSKEIQSHFPDVKIKTVAFDFSSDEGLVKLVEEKIKGLDVGILINNVGVTYPAASYFHEVDEKVWMNIIRVNLEGTTRVTMAVVPGMLQRKRGAIVNLGSGAAVVVPSHPLYTIYAATKAYVDKLSTSLYMEYKEYGIDVQIQVPLYVATKMVSKVAAIERSSLFIPSADAYAEAAVKRIGYEARCTPFWAHSLQWWFARLVPDSLLDAWRLSIGLNRRGKLAAI